LQFLEGWLFSYVVKPASLAYNACITFG